MSLPAMSDDARKCARHLPGVTNILLSAARSQPPDDDDDGDANMVDDATSPILATFIFVYGNMDRNNDMWMLHLKVSDDTTRDTRDEA